MIGIGRCPSSTSPSSALLSSTSQRLLRLAHPYRSSSSAFLPSPSPRPLTCPRSMRPLLPVMRRYCTGSRLSTGASCSQPPLVGMRVSLRPPLPLWLRAFSTSPPTPATPPTPTPTATSTPSAPPSDASSSSSSSPSSSTSPASPPSSSSSSPSSSPSEPLGPAANTIPVTSDGNLDAELGEAMASTGADLSTPAHHLSDDPSRSLTALEMDAQGRHVERDYSPLQLARRFALHPRDMRFLDSSLRNLPSLLVRKEVIIVNLELFKAIISAKEVLLFDPWYPHIQSVVPLMKHALTAFHKRKQQGEEDNKAPNPQPSPASPDLSPAPSTVKLATVAGPPPLPSSSPSPSSSSSSASSSPHSSSSSSASSFSPFSQFPSSLPSAADARPPPHTPTVREMAADLESAFRDRSLFGLRDHEREYEEWMEPRMPFEFIALELILMTVTRTLESRFEVYNSSLSPLLSSSSTTLNEGSTLMHLLQLKNGLTSFEVVLEETGMAIKAVLEDDRDMLDMFLTMKARGQVPRIDEHGEIEVLLETYLRKVDELENEVRTNVKSISLTEEHIQIRLDTMRNAMMKVDLLVTICTFGVATAALVASTFGMNLRSHLENSATAFYVTSAVMVLLAVVLVRLGLRMCRQHKIDLFHVEPDEPKLRLPVNSLKKHKRRSSPVHRVKRNGEEGEEGGDGGAEPGGLYDRQEWYQQTLEWKLQKLEEMREKQHLLSRHQRHRAER